MTDPEEERLRALVQPVKDAAIKYGEARATHSWRAGRGQWPTGAGLEEAIIPAFNEFERAAMLAVAQAWAEALLHALCSYTLKPSGDAPCPNGTTFDCPPHQRLAAAEALVAKYESEAQKGRAAMSDTPGAVRQWLDEHWFARKRDGTGTSVRFEQPQLDNWADAHDAADARRDAALKQATYLRQAIREFHRAEFDNLPENEWPCHCVLRRDDCAGCKLKQRLAAIDALEVRAE